MGQTCVAYAKGSQARQIIRGEQLKFTKGAETVTAIEEAYQRVAQIPEWIDNIEVGQYKCLWKI